MDLDAIQQMFFQESEEGLQALESCFALCREGADDAETINTIFRSVHSIKGGAGAFGHERLQTFAHHYESVLDQLRSGGLTMTPALLDVLLSAFDKLADHVAAARNIDLTVRAPSEAMTSMVALAGCSDLLAKAEN